MLNFTDGTSFTTGRAKYLDQGSQADEGSADTGAPWSVLNVELAETLGLLGGDGEQVTINTRDGTFDGRLEEAILTILAEDGQSITVDATVFVSHEWRGQTFLGYMGLLERIRFALDPQMNDFHFGSY